MAETAPGCGQWHAHCACLLWGLTRSSSVEALVVREMRVVAMDTPEPAATRGLTVLRGSDGTGLHATHGRLSLRAAACRPHVSLSQAGQQCTGCAKPLEVLSAEAGSLPAPGGSGCAVSIRPHGLLVIPPDWWWRRGPDDLAVLTLHVLRCQPSGQHHLAVCFCHQSWSQRRAIPLKPQIDHTIV